MLPRFVWVAFIFSILAVVAVFVASRPRTTSAAGSVPLVSIDLDTLGNTVTPCASYPCNNSTTLGPVDQCRSIAVGQTIQIDVVAFGVPAGGASGSDMSGAGVGGSENYLYWVPSDATGAPGAIALVGKDFSVALPHQGPGDNPGGTSDGTSGAASTSGLWHWRDTDTNPNLAGEGGDGIMVRLTIKGISAGTAGLELTGGPSPAGFFDIHGGSYSLTSRESAAIVVGGPCPHIPHVYIDTDITGTTVTPCDANGDPSLDYPCNDSTTLGPQDSCRSIAVGQSIQIDIVGNAIPAGGAYGATGIYGGAEAQKGAGLSDMALDWTPNGPTGPIQITGRNSSAALIHQGLDDNPGGGFSGTSGANSTSGHWKWTDADVNPDLVGEGGPGLAIRLTIKGINPGTATLNLAPNSYSLPTWTDYYEVPYPVDDYDGATIVVGGPCPSPTPSPSPAPTPAVGGFVDITSGGSGGSRSPMRGAILAVAAVAALAASFWYTRRRRFG